MKTVIDFALIIALQEEFDVVNEVLQLTPQKLPGHSENLGKWYRWKFKDIQGNTHVGFVSFIGAMGPAHATKFATKFLEHYSPRILVNLGLSGTLSKDVKLGDVVLSTLADLYDDAGTIEDIDGQPQLIPSGLPILTDWFTEAIQHFDYRQGEHTARWKRSCKKNKKDLIGTVISQIPSSLITDESFIHTGHIACGSVVVKSEPWKNALMRKDRKYLCVDMESAAIAFANEKNHEDGKSQMLIARVISDPADKRKEELDAVGFKNGERGAIRKWALLNGINFLKEFMPVLACEDIDIDLDPREDSVIDFIKRQHQLLNSQVIACYEYKKSSAISHYENFFRFFVAGEADWSFDQLVLGVEGLRQGPTAVATIVGYAGTGKSALLSCMWLHQIARYQDGRSNYLPAYVDLRTYFTSEYADEKSACQAFRKDFRSLFGDEILKESVNIMLIVDGCDEYYRDPLQTHIDQELKILLSEFSHAGKVIKIVGLGSLEEEAFLSESRSDTLLWASRETLISLNRVRTDSSQIQDILESYIEIIPEQSGAVTVGDLESAIRKYSLKEIDLFILSLLETSIRLKWQGNSTGVGSLYYQYCINSMRSFTSTSIGSDKGRSLLREISQYVFSTFVEHSTVGAHALPLPEEDRIHLSFVHQHHSLREFLIAEHVVQRILGADVDHEKLFDCIYPYGINRFVKSIVNRNVEEQRRLLDVAQRLYQTAGLNQKAHLAYILGRFEDRGLKRMSIEVLRKYLTEGKSDSRQYGNPEDQEFRLWLLLLRTIYISMIYLGDVKAADEYLDAMLMDAKWDDLNRGFHLEYYEDIQKPAASSSLIAFDDVSVSPKKTFVVLYDKLSTDCKTKRSRAMSTIELHTLCTLCVNRHVAGLLEDSMRRSLLWLVEKLVNGRGFVVSKKYAPYLDMTRRVLAQPGVSAGIIVSELLDLKLTPRAGWNALRKLDSGEIMQRNCPRSESVAEHTFGCLLIAEAFLPDSSLEEGYSKSEILRLLLMHDLAEVFEGDKVRFSKTETDIRSEDKRMRSIAALGSIDTFEGFRTLMNRWDRFCHRSEINAQIAKDIDQIECYLQLLKYHGDTKCTIPDAEIWAIEMEGDMQTLHGKRIFESLRHAGSDVLSLLNNAD